MKVYIRVCARPHHGLDALRVHEPVVDGVDRLVPVHVRGSLQQDGPRVEPVVRPEDAEAGLPVPVDQGPVDSRADASWLQCNCFSSWTRQKQ